jgi:hypothetical protein
MIRSTRRPSTPDRRATISRPTWSARTSMSMDDPAAAATRIRRRTPLPLDPSEDELARHGSLTPSDLAVIAECRGSNHRRRFALQLVLDRPGREPTERVQAQRIRRHLGLSRFDKAADARLRDWLRTGALEGRTVLDLLIQAEERLRLWQVMLPARACLNDCSAPARVLMTSIQESSSNSASSALFQAQARRAGRLLSGRGSQDAARPNRRDERPVPDRHERPVRLSGTVYCHKAMRKSYSELGFRSGRRAPSATACGRSKAYRPRKLMCLKRSGETLAMSSWLMSHPSRVSWSIAAWM